MLNPVSGNHNFALPKLKLKTRSFEKTPNVKKPHGVKSAKYTAKLELISSGMTPDNYAWFNIFGPASEPLNDVIENGRKQTHDIPGRP